MSEVNKSNFGESSYGKQFAMVVGVVKNNHDLAQQGRLQVFIPSIDSENFKVEDLPWAIYVSPFAGVTANLIVGRENLEVPGISSYGQWAIPKNGAQVLIGFLNGSPQARFWLGCLYMPEHNRTIPSYIDGGKTELDDTGQYPPKRVAWLDQNHADAGLGDGAKHFKTRGQYERSIAHPSNRNKKKPRDNGYASNPNEPKNADSQTYVPFRTPGGHYGVASDVDEHCRLRFKTIAGNQVIFDDTNERIYVSTAKGRNWVELDETNGKIYVYSDSKINIRGKNDINLYSDENINIVARKRLNLESEQRSVVIQAKYDITAKSTDANVKLTASRDICLVTTNGPKAPPLPELKVCAKSGWHGPGMPGWIYNWAEQGGSATSDIRFDSAGATHGSSKDSIMFATKQSIDFKTATNLNLQAASGINILAGTEYTVQAGSAISHNAPSLKWTNDGSPISLHAIGQDSDRDSINIPVYADQNATSASKAKQANSTPPISNAPPISNQMIRPNHESWERDEDESKCKTERGPHYQG